MGGSSVRWQIEALPAPVLAVGQEWEKKMKQSLKQLESRDVTLRLGKKPKISKGLGFL
jgi:hypothetical protein